VEKLEQAIRLRKEDKPEEALSILKELLSKSPNDPNVNYQAAWTCDFMGKESDAAPFYETAIANGLSGEERRGAFLGLGSTYRCLGEYQKSLDTFDKAINEFPSDRSLKTFRALTLYNLGKFSNSVEELLTQLIDTTADENIKAYEKALRFYSSKLDQTWE
jgi:tetratricopeptide (TPR) repeat protein